jgi:WD40 repeat protein
LFSEDIDAEEFAFSADNHTLIAQGYDTLRIWNTTTFQVEKEITFAAQQYPAGVGYTPDEKQIVTLDQKANRLEVWDATSLERIKSVTFPVGYYALSVNPDGTQVALRTNGKLAIWDINAEKMVSQIENQSFAESLLAFSSDGHWLAAQAGYSISLWDLHTGENSRDLSIVLPEGISVINLAFSDDSQRLYAANSDGTVSVWDMTTYSLIHTIKTYDIAVNLAVFVGGANHLLVLVSYDDTLYGWNLDTEQPIDWIYNSDGNPVNTLDMPVSGITAIAVHDDRPTAVGTDSGQIYVQQTSTDYSWKEIASDPLYRKVNALTYFQDGGTLISAGDNGVVEMWSPETGEHLGVLNKHQSSIYAIAAHRLLNDYTIIMSAGCGHDRTNPWEGGLYCDGAEMNLWTYDGQHPIPSQHTDIITSAVFNADGTLLATASDDGTIVLWGSPVP